jgi:alpha-methylacyl-CoA racemase
MTDGGAHGPLAGVRVVEVGSIGPGPFAAMLLADMGAQVIRLERAPGGAPDERNIALRGRPAIPVDLKSPAGRELVLRLCEGADALIEGFRPGVMERLRLGPDEVAARSPRLVYGRMTGYGQDGPMSLVAGHDINYLSLSGALGAMQRQGEKPMFPLNLLGDYGGGGMFLAFGVVCGILEARGSGRGQVVDAAMVDGVAVLSTLMHAMAHMGSWDADAPGTNMLDSGAHFYEIYETKDGQHMAVGAIEPQFYRELLELLGLEADAEQFSDWPAKKQHLADVFRTRTRVEWAELLERREACATPVLGLVEAASHPHNVERRVFVEVGGLRQPAPAPRFSRTPGAIQEDAMASGSDPATVLQAWGLASDEVASFLAGGALGG